MTHSNFEQLSGKDNSIISSDAQECGSLASLPAPILEWIDRNMSGFITVLDRDGIIRYISKTVEQLLGFGVEKMIGTNWSEWVSAEDITSVQTYFDNTVHNQQRFNLDLQLPGGDWLATTNLLTSVKDNKKQLFYIVATSDITDEKEAEDILVHSEKMSIAGQLASGIVHEIRNPLTSLKGFLQLLQAGVNNEEAFYSIMIDEIEKMESITSELLFISKPMTDRKELQNLSNMIEDVVTLFRSQANFKSIQIEQHVNENRAIKCDRSQIKQVFINLLKNAVEAMDKPGRITVVDKSYQQNIMIDIIDEGPGIDEDIIHKLGEPFFTTKQNGTGLGLMITKQILENHGGEMAIFQNDGRGSTFRVILPDSDNN